MYVTATAGPYVSHYLARKNAKFTMNLSATRHAALALGRCGESSAHTVTSNLLKLIYMFPIQPA